MDTQSYVASGVELLDERYPEWRDAIDLEYLDMGDPFMCVLGQLAVKVSGLDSDEFAANYKSGYDYMIEEIMEVYEHDPPGPWLFGFDSTANVGYEDLDQAWTEAIAGSD